MSTQNNNQKTPSKPMTCRQLLVESSKRRGRLTKLDKLPAELINRVLEIVKLGVYDHVAAMSLGVAKTTWAKWMTAGAEAVEQGDHKNIYGMFYLAVQEARSEARILAEATIHSKNPIAWLKSVAPEDWCETTKMEIRSQTELDVNGDIGFNLVPPNTVAEGMEYLAELGYLETTALGAKLLPDKEEKTEDAIDVDSE